LQVGYKFSLGSSGNGPIFHPTKVVLHTEHPIQKQGLGGFTIGIDGYCSLDCNEEVLHPESLIKEPAIQYHTIESLIDKGTLKEGDTVLVPVKLYGTKIEDGSALFSLPKGAGVDYFQLNIGLEVGVTPNEEKPQGRHPESLKKEPAVKRATLWEIAKEIVRLQKEYVGKHNPNTEIDCAELESDWFDYLEEKLIGDEEAPQPEQWQPVKGALIKNPDGSIFELTGENQENLYGYKVIKAGRLFKEVNETGSLFLYHGNGTLRDDIECIMPTKPYEPKEEELVWVKFLGEKCTFRRWADCDNGQKHPVVENKHFEKITVPLSELEPYNNQDKA